MANRKSPPPKESKAEDLSDPLNIPAASEEALAEAAKPAKVQGQKSASELKLVRMIRDGKSADVHPDEVENYAAGGWEKA